MVGLRVESWAGLLLDFGFYPLSQASTCFAIHLLAAQVWAVGGGTGETIVILLGCFRAGVFNRSPRGHFGCFESVRHSVFGLVVCANSRPKAERKLRKRFGHFLLLRPQENLLTSTQQQTQ